MRENYGSIKETLGECGSVREYIAHKLHLLDESGRDMRALFGLMFSERGNVLAETTDGFRVRTITYGECADSIERRSARLAYLLSSVPHGSKVGLCMENSPDWIEIFWSILKAGYEPLLVNMRADDETINSVFAEYGVRAAVSDGRGLNAEILVSPAQIDEAPALHGAENAPFGNEVYFMSSGTSSQLKICGYTGEEFCHQIRCSADILRRNRSIKRHWRGRLKLLAFLPFYHIFGFAAVYVWFCFFSRTLVFLGDMAPDTITDTVRKHGVTHIFAVPLFWEKLYDAAVAKIKERGAKTYRRFLRGMKLAGVPVIGRLIKKFAFREVRDNIFGESVMFMISGGGNISERAMRFANRIGYRLVNGYGMTETGIASVELSERASVRERRSVGKPFGCVRFDIRDGELFVRSDAMARDIFVGGERVAADARGYATGDLFECVRGEYYILGRKDDLLVGANGENLNPELIEPKLAADGVRGLCLVRSGGGIALVAEISPYCGGNRISSMRSEIASRIAALGLSGSVNEIVLTTRRLIGEKDFKISRSRVACRLAAGELCTVTADTAGGDESDTLITGKLRGIFAEALNRDVAEIGFDDNFFFDLGGNSLDYFAMVSAVCSEFGIGFPSSDTASAATVRDVAKLIKSFYSEENIHK